MILLTLMVLLLNSSQCPLSTHVVNMPHLVSDLGPIPIFEWYVVKCGSKNRYQKSMFKRNMMTLCSKMISILRSIVEHKWGTCMAIE
jgi:hypothetical protein